MILELGVFASGRGSNFQSILKRIDQGKLQARVRLLISNNSEAGALEIARKRGIPARVISRSDFTKRDEFIETLQKELRKQGVEFVVLAGYMKKIPPEVVAMYPGRMINIHPALLPSFGGKGMYGSHVHQAVLEAGCKVTGVTVHLVDEQYDRGPIIAQRCVAVESEDTVESLAARVLTTEHSLYPDVLQWFAEERVCIKDRRVFLS